MQKWTRCDKRYAVARRAGPIMLLLVLLCGLSVWYSSSAHASTFQLDPTYGSGGTVLTSFGNEAMANSVAFQSDGKAVVGGFESTGGHKNWAIVRYNTDGTLDTSFGGTGKVIQDFGFANRVSVVKIQPDGKIVVAGADRGAGQVWTIGRYNPDGSLDTTFGINGIAALQVPLEGGAVIITGLGILSDGSIVTSGTTGENASSGSSVIVVRTDSHGNLDPTFGNGGIVTTHFAGVFDGGYFMALQPDGKILVSGDYTDGGPISITFVLRYNTDGSLDQYFGNGGLVSDQFASGPEGGDFITLQPDGKIVVAGYYGTANYLQEHGTTYVLRYNSDGSRDPSFANNGLFTHNYSLNGDVTSSIAILSDGSMIAGGYISTGSQTVFALRGITADGTVETNFGSNGLLTTAIGAGNDDVFDVGIQSDGKIIAVGNASNGSYNDWALARYALPDTTPPVLSVPSTIAVNATSSAGASVTYTVTATDPDNQPSDLTIACAPASGSTFPIGSTTVTCMASDPAGNTTTSAFQVVVAPPGKLCTPNPTAIQSNFNGTPIPVGDSILFTGVLKVQGLPANQTATVFFLNQAITFTANGFTYNTANVGMPAAQVTIDPSATQATTTFDTTTGTWKTVTPPNTAGTIFLSAYMFAPSLFGQSGGLPGGINPVTWTGTIRVQASVPLTVSWQWAAAVYTSLSTDNNALGIKPVDDNHASQYQNSDHAGTPENDKSFVTGGARGGGGSNYTGSLSGTAGVSCAS